MPRYSLIALATAGLVGCAPTPTLKVDDTYHGSPPKPVAHPLYDPFSPPGTAGVTWVAPTYNGDGTIVKPVDPSQSWNWEDYQAAPWFVGGSGGPHHPAGTF